MSQRSVVATNICDLSDVTYGSLLDVDSPEADATLEQFLLRIDEPGASISGYNPQRLDDEPIR